MAFEWRKDLETGIKWQDDQHRELFRRINSLLDSMSVGLGKEEVIKLYRFLDEYFVVHFETEEQAMHRYGYPDTLRHLEEHTRFIEEIKDLEKDAEGGGVTAGLVIKTQRRVVDWFINHICEVDKAFGAFLKNAVTEKGKKAGD